MSRAQNTFEEMNQYSPEARDGMHACPFRTLEKAHDNYTQCFIDKHSQPDVQPSRQASVDYVRRFENITSNFGPSSTPPHFTPDSRYEFDDYP
jgi:hypothetical protein